MQEKQPVYVFKVTPEFCWLLVVTVGGVIATAIATQGAVPPTSWQSWAIGLGTAVVRAVGGVLLSNFASSRPA